MSLTIWKFPIPVTDDIEIEMPAGAEVLHVAEQAGQVCLWALVRPDAPVERRRFRLAGTGHAVTTDVRRRHVGTVLLHDGALVFHLFELEGLAT